MIIRRPSHLVQRPMTGAMFGEPAVLYRRQQTRNKFGDLTYAETPVNITVATNPLSATDPRFASLQESGVRVEDTREFFTAEEISTGGNNKPRDEIEYNAERYVVHSTARYAGHSESVFVRKEVQS